MTNKLKAIIHFTISIAVILVFMLILIVLFLPMGSEAVDGFTGVTFSINSQSVLGISFGSSLIFTLILYGLLTLIINNGSKSPSKILIPLMLSILAMSMLIALILFCFDSIEANDRLVEDWKKPFFYSLLSIATLFIMPIAQGFTTKFLLISTTKNRSDEWEIANFFNMLFTKSNIEHKKNVSILYSGDAKLAIRFIPEEEVERKVTLSGDVISNDVSFLLEEINVSDDVKYGVIVFISNTLPEVEGSSDSILVLKDNDLFKFFKTVRKQNNG